MLEVNNSTLNSAVAAIESGNQPAFVAFVDRSVDYRKIFLQAIGN